MDKDINEIKILLAQIESDIRHHIRRTDLLEGEVKQWRNDLEPIYKHIGFVNGLAKFLVVSAALVTAIVGIVALFK